MKKEEIKKVVRENYANIARQNSSCCGPTAQGDSTGTEMNPCCGTGDQEQNVSKIIGYTAEELKSLPEGADLGLGCGNPVALASLKEGDTYLDLGSGAGIDCFLAARKVGKTGKAIGVDMTPEMLDKARENAKKGEFENVEFRLGEIEHLPVTDNSVDVITSNCVINLSPDKKAVFEDAFRVLKPGGKVMISDIVLLKPLPEEILDSIEAYVGCISGAILKDEYLEIVKEVGFEDIEVVSETTFPTETLLKDSIAQTIIEKLQITPEEVREFGGSILSLKFSAKKPE
ncbi:MAG: arsenite methyltransferase [Thermoplasmata archaeon]|nr:arsenite methyltransferase [Thermoplasmata archaeon]